MHEGCSQASQGETLNSMRHSHCSQIHQRINSSSMLQSSMMHEMLHGMVADLAKEESCRLVLLQRSLDVIKLHSRCRGRLQVHNLACRSRSPAMQCISRANMHSTEQVAGSQSMRRKAMIYNNHKRTLATSGTSTLTMQLLITAYTFT